MRVYSIVSSILSKRQNVGMTISRLYGVQIIKLFLNIPY